MRLQYTNHFAEGKEGILVVAHFAQCNPSFRPPLTKGRKLACQTATEIHPLSPTLCAGDQYSPPGPGFAVLTHAERGREGGLKGDALNSPIYN